MAEQTQLHSSELRSWLGAIDRALQVVEQAAWDVRSVAAAAAGQASDLWRDVRRDWRRIEDDVRELGAELSAWPQRAQRAAATGWTLAQVAASYRLHPTRAAFLSHERARRALDALHERNARLFAETSARQGGGILKVGQLLSTRPDLLPEHWIAALAPLQDDAPPVPFERVRRKLEAELGAPLEERFAAFEAAPVAAASIGQVHRASTHEGVDVAVKVTRPDIEAWIELDLDLLELFLETVRSLFPPADYPTIVGELRQMLRRELDYEHEARMMERLADFFAASERVIVPRALPEHCTRGVLVSRFVEGRKITRVLDDLHARRGQGDAEAGARLDGILATLLETYARQILVAGIFQADPHPGNFLVTDDDRLVLLDFGCTRTLEPAVRDRYLSLVGAFLANDGARVARILDELGFATASGSPDTLHAFAELLLGEFRDALTQGFGPERLDPEQIRAKAREVLRLVEADPVTRIPAEFVMLGRVFLTLGGLFGHYRPHIDYARPLLSVLAERGSFGGAS